MVGTVRRRASEDDPLADVPQHLRAFPAGWLEVAAQGPDGYAEALAAAESWLEERRAWQEVHGYRGNPLEWVRAMAWARRDVWRASEVWRPESQRWMTQASRWRRR